jgi:hypothetical protein
MGFAKFELVWISWHGSVGVGIWKFELAWNYLAAPLTVNSCIGMCNEQVSKHTDVLVWLCWCVVLVWVASRIPCLP